MKDSFDQILRDLAIFISFFVIGFVLGTCVLNSAHAQNKAPSPFQDSKIERVLNNGQVQKFDGNEYMIVKRRPKNPNLVVLTKARLAELEDAAFMRGVIYEGSRIVEMQNLHNVRVTKVDTPLYEYSFEPNYKPKRNRLSIIGGVGPDRNLEVSSTPTSVRIETDTTLVFGLMYQRLLTETLSIGIMGLDNGTGALTLGVDF